MAYATVDSAGTRNAMGHDEELDIGSGPDVDSRADDAWRAKTACRVLGLLDAVRGV